MKSTRIAGLVALLALMGAACSVSPAVPKMPATSASGVGTAAPGAPTTNSKTSPGGGLTSGGSGGGTSGAPTTNSKTSPGGGLTSGGSGGGTSGGSGGTQPAVLSAPLPTPAPVAWPPGAGGGQWSPAGRRVDGVPAVYETTVRPPGTQSAAGIAWMDTALLAGQLYSGSESPGGGPWQFSAPIKPSAAASLVAAFNGGFKDRSSDGGYYTQGTVVLPLRVGAASLVFYADGSVTVGQWGRDVSMTPSVVGVRQNLNLLVDGGQAVPGLNPADTTVWGSTLGNVPDVWRSAVGVTGNGALVYVAGPLEITQLANLLVAAGVLRGMELDINPYWTCLVTYDPPAGLAGPGNGTDLLPNMVQSPGLFFEPSWARDFVTMSARSGPIP